MEFCPAVWSGDFASVCWVAAGSGVVGAAWAEFCDAAFDGEVFAAVEVLGGAVGVGPVCAGAVEGADCGAALGEEFFGTGDEGDELLGESADELDADAGADDVLLSDPPATVLPTRSMAAPICSR